VKMTLRKIFGYKGKELRGKGRKLHSEELYGFHFPTDIIRLYINYQLDALTIIYS